MIRHTITSSRADTVLRYASSAANALRDITDSDATNSSYLKSIAGITSLILDAANTVKVNKEQCIRLVEQISRIVYAIVNIVNETEAELSLHMLRNISEFSETLQKVHGFIRRQLESGIVRRLVQYKENSAQLDECSAALDHAINMFGVRNDIFVAAKMTEIQRNEAERHREVMELLNEGLDEPEMARDTDFETLSIRRLGRSTSTLSLTLPGRPKIFHGREIEREHIFRCLVRDSEPARVAILGPGGIGKSSLALSVLHDSQAVSKFGAHRYFIACDASSSSSELVYLVAMHFGLRGKGNPSKAVIRYLSSLLDPILLVLDNLEMAWEPFESRVDVEEFLSLLTDIPQLHLLVTLRGAERPTKVRWTRPFLPPLAPLNDAAAKQTFTDITDDADDDLELQQLLTFTDNVPLAITLIANLSAFEGCRSVLNRWKNETTAMISDGFDRQSSLNKSITISLSSPRMTSTPDAQVLLSLLSVLPDGLPGEAAMKEVQLSLRDISRCKTTLLRTSLAYLDAHGRLRSLVPIREYMRAQFPPPLSIVRPLRVYIFGVVKIFESFGKSSSSSAIVHRVSAEMGNIHSLIQLALRENGPDLRDTVQCVLELATFSHRTNLGSFDLLRLIGNAVDQLNDEDLRGEYFYALAVSNDTPSSFESMFLEALRCFKSVNNASGQAKTYIRLAFHYMVASRMPQALECCNNAISLAKQADDTTQESHALVTLAQLYTYQGNHRAALASAQESLLVAKASGDLLREAAALFNKGMAERDLGHYQQAAILFKEAERLGFALGLEKDSHLHRDLLLQQAETHLKKTEYEEARRLNALVVGAGSEVSVHGSSEPYALLNIVFIDIITGDDSGDLVQRNLETARRRFLKISDTFGLTACNIVFGDLQYRMGHYAEAKELFLLALSSVRHTGPELAMMCMERLTDVGNKQDDVPSFLHYAVLHLALALRTHDSLAIHQALRHLGDVLLRLQDEDTALHIFQAALEGFTLMGIHRGRGDCMLRIGDILMERGEVKEARKMWASAQSLFLRSSQKKDQFECAERLRRSANPVAS